MNLCENLKNSPKIMELFSGYLYLYYESENFWKGGEENGIRKGTIS